MPRYNLRDATARYGRILRSDSVTSAIGPLGSSAIYFNGGNVNPPPAGVSCYVNSSEAADLSFPADFTFEGYVQLDVAAIADDKGILVHNSGWHIYRLVSTGKMVLRVDGVVRITSLTTIAPGTNYKWSVTRAGGVSTLRINGVAEGATYSNSNSLNSGSLVLLGGLGGAGTNNLRGFLDEVALYNVAKYAADYTPTFAEVPDGEAGLLFLAHGDYAIPSAAVGIGAPASLQAFPPVWPARIVGLTPPPPVYRYYWGGLGRIVGTTKIKGTPNTPVSRRVRLIREVDSVCVGERWSDPATGYYAFEGFDPLQLYTVIVYDGPRVFRAAVQDAVVPEAYTP